MRQPVTYNLARLIFRLAAAGACVTRHQLALPGIKHLILFDHPLVMAITAQRTTLVLFLEGLLFEGYYVGHC